MESEFPSLIISTCLKRPRKGILQIQHRRSSPIHNTYSGPTLAVGHINSNLKLICVLDVNTHIVGCQLSIRYHLCLVCRARMLNQGSNKKKWPETKDKIGFLHEAHA